MFGWLTPYRFNSGVYPSLNGEARSTFRPAGKSAAQQLGGIAATARDRASASMAYRRGRAGVGPRRAGSLAVEVAAIAPVLFLMIMGGVEVCRASMIRNTVENAAYEGARRGLVSGATEAQVVAAAMELVDAVRLRGAVVTVTPAVIVASTEQVRVTVRVPYNQNSYILPRFLDDADITGECALTREVALNQL